MSDCTQCPHVVGDSFDRDCCFPDCSGGWEEVCKQLQAELQAEREKSVKLKQLLNAACWSCCDDSGAYYEFDGENGF